MKKHIFLTGFMGAGKSKAGARLALWFNLPFWDTDKIIEQEHAKSISQIFKEDGEPAFRRMEAEIVARLATSSFPAVIALGGGALLHQSNFELAQKNGLIIYLKSSPEAIFERIKVSEKRPLLIVEQEEDNKEEILARIRRLLNERTAIYEQADIVFDRDGLELEQLISKLVSEINDYWEQDVWK